MTAWDTSPADVDTFASGVRRCSRRERGSA